MKVELDLSNYAKTDDFKGGVGVVESNLLVLLVCKLK